MSLSIFSRNFFRIALLLVAVLMVSACSSNKLVPTYEGDVLSRDQHAVLVAPDNISLLSVNGRDVPTYMLADISTSYALKPGLTKVLFKYESIWSKGGARSSDTPRSEKVESLPLYVSFEAKAGESYNFSYLEPGNVREAKALVADITINLNSSDSTLVGQSVIYQDESLKASGGDMFAADSVQQASEANLDTANLSPLEALKALWPAASAKEKKAFLVWAFQE